MNLRVGSNIVHSLHGVGQVETIEERNILDKVTRFAIIAFQNDRLKIMVNMDQKNQMIRPLITSAEVESVMEHLKNFINPTTITKSTLRYNLNLQKIKSGDVTSLCEVIKELSGLLEEKKLTQKEQTMLAQSRKILAAELSQVTKRSEEEMEKWIEETCTGPRPEMATL